MQNTIPKFRQSSIVFEKPGILSRNLKNWQKLNFEFEKTILNLKTALEFNIFCWNFAHVYYLPMSTKGCVGFFFILFTSWVICKN